MQKSILLKASVIGLIVISALYIAPLDQFKSLRSFDFHVIFYTYLLIFVGLVMIIEFGRNMPDARDSYGATTGAFTFLIIGIIALAYGGGIFAGVYDPFEDKGMFALMLSLILGITAVLLLVGLMAEVKHRKTLAKYLRNL